MRLIHCTVVVATAMLGSATAAASAEMPAPAMHQSAKADPRFAIVRAAIAKVLEDPKIPSVAVAVVKDGQIIWEEGFGWADREKQVAATAHTAYSLASMTKPITATAAMKLQEAGKLDIDSPIERYLSGTKLTGYAGSTDAVTARRIMSHSAGLPKYGHFYLDGSTPAGSSETISRFGMVVFPPNTRFEYSNIGMKILDAAIEKVSGLSYGQYLDREIFSPLGMKDSALGLPQGTAAAVRYDDLGKPMRFYLTDHPGSGDVWSSAHDVARFLAFHLGTPLPGQEPVLSRATVEAMQRPAGAITVSFPGEPPRKMGANWILDRLNGHPQVWHPGGQPGVSTFMALYPDQKLAMVVLANGSADLSPVSGAIRKAVAPALVEAEAEAAPPVARPVPLRGRWSGTAVNYAGQQAISLTFGEAGTVFAELGGQPRTTLTNAAFTNGTLSGRFTARSNLPETRGEPIQLAIDVVAAGKDLVGQLVARKMDDSVVFTLPSFVRLTPAPD